MPTFQTPVRPVLPNARELYDQIMAAIEPELTTAILPTLQSKYANESAADRTMRLKRYTEAFARYELEYANYMLKLDSLVRDYKHAAIKYVEGKVRVKEDAQLSDLETSMQSL